MAQQSRSDRLARNKRRNRRTLRLTMGWIMVALLLLIIYIWWNHDESIDEVADQSPITVPHDKPPIVQRPDTGAKDNETVDHPDPTEEQLEDNVQLAFVGDIMMGGKVDLLLQRNGYDYPYQHISTYLSEADIAAANLENPITDRGQPYDKQYVFRTSPLAVPELARSGLDIFSLANNHTLDFGMEGLLDTMDLLKEAGLHHIGAGMNEDEAYQPVIVDVNGIKAAYLGFSRVVPHVSWKADKKNPGLAETYDYRRPVAAIEKAKEQADIVVVLVHWGLEKKTIPEQYQTELGHRYIDAGADLVIGSHPHVLQGIESYKGKWIAYSLGNFIFTTNENAATKQSAILQTDCSRNGDCVMQVLPIHTGVAQPKPMDDVASQALFEQLNQLSIQAMIDEHGRVNVIDTSAMKKEGAER
jgi:poly-gamma-glutamate capsule biosynthesis protein CapA/YwtB (metallophosphatase superfamily)